jgi:hypothetical protein
MVNKTLTEADLSALGATMTVCTHLNQVPTGWTYTFRVLDADLSISPKNGKAYIIRDSISNNYQKVV